MHYYKKSGTHGLLFLVWSCIGIDYQDDALSDPVIELEAEQVGLQIGEELQLSPRYLDEFGRKQAVNFSYTSSNPASAEVNSAGLVTGKSTGTSFVQVRFEEKVMRSVQSKRGQGFRRCSCGSDFH